MPHDDTNKSGHTVRTSTIVLIILFVLTLSLYIYLHGSTSIDLFNEEPETSTVQPIPVIPWGEYQKMGESTTGSTSEFSSSEMTTEETEIPERSNIDESEEPEPQPTDNDEDRTLP